jgi:hypothetical protein
MNRKPKTKPEIELRPDGWARFEIAIGAAVKSGPKHRAASKKKPVNKTARSVARS